MMNRTLKVEIIIVKDRLVIDSITTVGAVGKVVGYLANSIGLDGKSAYQIAVKYGYKGTEQEYGYYPITQGNYAKEAVETANSAATAAVQSKTDAEQATAKANTATQWAQNAAQNATEQAALAQSAAQVALAKATAAHNAADNANAKATVAHAAADNANSKAALADTKATYATMQGDHAKTQGDYAKAQGDYASGKAAQYLLVTVSGTSSAPIFAFTKVNFDAVVGAINNGAPIFVKFTDNRTAANKLIDLSGIHPAVWNTTLSQIEVQNPNIARGFYLNGTTVAHRGCVSINTAKYVANSAGFAKFNPTTGYYEVYNNIPWMSGIIDVTEAQMSNSYCRYYGFSGTASNRGSYATNIIRFNYPFKPLLQYNDLTGPSEISGAFRDAAIENLVLNASVEKVTLYGNLLYLFYGAYPKNIPNIIDVSNATNVTGIIGAGVINCRLSGLKISMNIRYATNISRDSLLYLINNSANISTVITITLEATALARLTPQDIALASSRNITLTA